MEIRPVAEEYDGMGWAAIKNELQYRGTSHLCEQEEAV
jgi:hypothetical protein